MSDARSVDKAQPFYESSNGDVWSLVSHPVSGARAVMHRPNTRSGGKISYIDIDEFLKESPHGPQHQALQLMQH
jgi:hypothetical protein